MVQDPGVRLRGVRLPGAKSAEAALWAFLTATASPGAARRALE